MMLGEITERNGCFSAPDETIIGGWARVFRKDREHPGIYVSITTRKLRIGKSQENLIQTGRIRPPLWLKKLQK